MNSESDFFGEEGDLLDLPDVGLNTQTSLASNQRLTNSEKMLCRMLVAGIKPKQACSCLGLSLNTLAWAKAKEEWKLYEVELQKSLDTEFQNLMFKVVETVRKSLDSADLNTAMSGANFWAKYSGRFQQKIEITHSAEDLVKLILTGDGRSDVQASKGVIEGANAASLQESNRDAISGPEQEGRDCPIPTEQHSGGYRQQLALPLGYT